MSAFEKKTDQCTWLRDRGSPVEKGRLRVHLAVLSESWWDDLSPPAHTELWATQWKSIQEIEKEQQPYCFGDSFLLQGDDAEAMWALRERYREEAKKHRVLRFYRFIVWRYFFI